VTSYQMYCSLLRI